MLMSIGRFRPSSTAGPATRPGTRPEPGRQEEVMTKSELIAEIANRTSLAKTDVEKTLKAFEDVVH